ncbi:hypothetical protein DI487_02155 [Flavobacterium sediminis]|uniref:LamG-like jellyroll fold domain-containing protein n=1 Tax=Flavobacterium sediminis TaxID=2201181 RepID=A0A2U8QRN7_9FLAO|nr:LamG-like jellyroll fold domain-containing protein [Flavobacterium sediminis]AWM12789.1 hypothetical protein DI487_02155 [Flavobacterium sediminis]
MKQKYFYSFLLFCLSVIAFSQTLDQSNAPSDNGGGSFTVSSTQNVGQSFVAGMTGDMTQVNLRVGNWGSVFSAGDFQLRIFDGNGYGGTVLNTTSFTITNPPVTNGYEELSVVLSSSVAIVSGNSYTIDFRGITGSVSTHGTGANYANGGLYFSDGNTILYDSYDLWFKTFLTVPTPATHLNFDGVNDYVNLGTSISTALNGATALTFEAWINPSVLNGWNNIITDYDGAYHKVLLRVRNNNNIQFVLNGTFLNSPFSVPLNTWTHIAAVYDGANMYVYANGTLIASQAASVSLPTTSNQFNIGNRISGSELFTGNIDEVRVWTTARTVEQINGSMNCELQGTESGLVAYYQFNQGIDQADNTSVTTLTDATSNGYDGTLTNFALTGSTSNWLAGSAVTTGSTVPVAPTVSTPVVYNQGATATALTATSGETGLLWYTTATGGTSSTTAPTPDTSVAGSTSYWVSSTNANGCESERAEIVVTVNAAATHLNFDGANDIVNLGTSLTTYFTGKTATTVEAWVRPETNSGLGVIAGNYDYPTSGLGLQMLLRRDNNGYSFWINGGTGYSSVVASNAVVLNTWQHVAGVWDGATMKIYVDGVLINSAAKTGAMPSITSTFVIGGNAQTVPEMFKGDIDEVRIWDIALADSDILATKDCELENGQNNIIAYYKFNQGFENADNSGVTSLTDSSGNNYNGTLNNFALTGSTSNWKIGSQVTTGNVCPLVLSSTAFNTNKFLMYPNPTKGIFTVRTEENVTIEVYDIVGKVVKKQKIVSGEANVDITALNSGIYIVKTIDSENNFEIFKLIKE